MNKKEGKNMNVAKKISSVLLALCLMVPCFSMVAYAADGKISFSDPETKVGEMCCPFHQRLPRGCRSES